MSLTASESTFTSEVLESPLPVLVHFWAPWCGLCRLIEPLLQSFQNDWLGQLRLVNVNADENFMLANRYRLTTLPTLIIFRDGDAYHRMEGFRGREELKRALETCMVSFGNSLPPLQPFSIKAYPEISVSD